MCVTLFFFSSLNKRSNLPSSGANIMIKLLSRRVYVLSLYHLLVNLQWFATIITHVHFIVKNVSVALAIDVTKFNHWQSHSNLFKLHVDSMFEMARQRKLHGCFDIMVVSTNKVQHYFKYLIWLKNNSNPILWLSSKNELIKIGHCVCRRCVSNLSLL